MTGDQSSLSVCMKPAYLGAQSRLFCPSPLLQSPFYPVLIPTQSNTFDLTSSRSHSTK